MPEYRHPIKRHIEKILLDNTGKYKKAEQFFHNYTSINREIETNIQIHITPLLVILDAIKIKYYDSMPMVIYSKLNVNFLMDTFLIREIEARAILTILKCDFGTPKQRQRKTVEWKQDYSTELLRQLYHIRLFDFVCSSTKDQPTAQQLKDKYSNKNKPHFEMLGGFGWSIYVPSRKIDAIWQILAHPSKKRNKK